MSTAAYRINFDEIKHAVSMEKAIAYLALPGLKQKNAKQ